MQRRQARRWRRWWRVVFGEGVLFADLGARSVGMLKADEHPEGLFEAVAKGLSPGDAMVRLLACVAGARHAG